MKILPSLEEVKKIAETGKYNVLPVSTEILSDLDYEDLKKRFDALLHARIGTGERQMGQIHILRL